MRNVDLDLYKLNLFVAVIRLGSFTKAAEYLHMSQPTVSQQIVTLERTLGVTLLERDTRHLRLTAAGQTLYTHALQLLDAANQAIEAVQEAAGKAAKTLRLGVGHTLATYLLPHVLHDYRQAYPEHVTRLTVGNTAQLLAALSEGTIDLALVGSPAIHEEITTEPFLRDRLMVIVSAHDPWVGRASVSMKELQDRVFLTREMGSALYDSVARLWTDSLLTPSDSVIILGETEAIKRSVEMGIGVALIQGIAIQREVRAGQLVALPLENVDDSRTYLIAQRRQAQPRDVIQAFIRVLKANLPTTS